MNGSWLDRNRTLVFVSLLFVAVGGAGVFYMRQPVQAPLEIQPVVEAATATVIPTPTASPTPAPVRVYVTGAVVNPDVYFLAAGSIIKDAVSAAGGFTADADPERINQALELQDQQQIHVPHQDEANAPPPVQGGPSQAQLSSQAGGSNRSDLISGESYIIQKSSDLRTWLPIQTNTASGPTMDISNVIDPAAGAWFFRAVR